MSYEKYIREDGKTAVLFSPGYGAGWYSWNYCNNYPDDDPSGLIFDKELVELVLKKDWDALEEVVDRKYPGTYLGGMEQLTVAFVDTGLGFRIHEYDGNESVRTFLQENYHTA